MFDSVKKGLYTGIGLALLARDRVEELAQEMADRNQLSEEDGKAFVDDMMNRTDEARKDVEERVEKLVKETVERFKVATRSDIERLEAEIQTLYVRVNILNDTVAELELRVPNTDIIP